MNSLRPAPVHDAKSWAASKPPLLRFLTACHADFATEHGGEVANYIPELGKADPDHFGISLATLDGHVYGLNAKDGSDRWSATLNSEVLTAPTIVAALEHVIDIADHRSGKPTRVHRLDAPPHGTAQ